MTIQNRVPISEPYFFQKNYNFLKKGVDKTKNIGYNIKRCHDRQQTSFGSLAQLGEHLPYKQRVTGSSPVVPTRLISSVGRAPDF